MIPALISAFGNIFGNFANVAQTKRNNQLQRELVNQQNQAAIGQARQAYEVSKPTTQVNNLINAGMSKAGALSAINGGGSYTPAPIQSAKTESPQMDLSHAFDGLIQAHENSKTRSMQKEMQDKQIEASKEQHQAQLESNERIAQLQADTTNRNADNRLAFDKEQFEFNKPKVLAEIENIKKNSKVLESVAKGNNLDNIRKEFENKQLPELAKIAQTEGWMRIQHLAQTMAHEDADHMNKQERESLELEFYRATMDSSIKLKNLQDELQIYLSASELEMYKTPGLGDFIGALSYVMNNLAPKFAIFK